jgi:hypothetical protein
MAIKFHFPITAVLHLARASALLLQRSGSRINFVALKIALRLVLHMAGAKNHEMSRGYAAWG